MTNTSVKFALLAVSALGTGVFAGGLPQGGVVQQGAAGIQYTGDTLNINQQSDKAIIDWKDFSVGRDNTVNFNQPDSDSATLNRVTGDFTSEIAGRINANGSVFLVNPNGILITADGVIDTGGFVASTLDMDNNDFLNGEYTFSKNGKNGVVSNRGSISVDDGGFVALLGGAVKNEGTIRALVGKVGFGGGEKIVMSFGNNDFLRVEVPMDKWHTLTDPQGNKVAATLDLGGTIDSRGGFIDIAVADASDILRQTISIDGIVSANTVSSTDGVISISGGTVGITGNGRITADADYGNAGTIAIDADTIDSSGIVSAVAQNGVGGTVEILLQQGANLNASTRFDVSGRSKGGSLSFISGLGKQDTKVLGSADFKADSAGGNGGYIDISTKGGLVGLLSGTVSASGKTQGGRIRLGGAFQGGGYNPKTSPLDKRTQALFVARWGDNSSLVRAGKTSLGTGVRIDVSSQSGTGGTAILWADNTTNNYASIDATGATGGGAVEISGKKRVDSFGLKRVKADGGVILLDPKNVVIGKWTGALAQIKKISASGDYRQSLQTADEFGYSVSLSGDGTKLAVGATGDDGQSKVDDFRDDLSYGAVYLYTIGTTSTWGDNIAQKVKIKNDVGGLENDALDKFDRFGSGVSLSDDGSKLAVGAFGDDTSGSDNKGAVYLFNIKGSGDSWGTTVTKVNKIDGNHSDLKSGADALDNDALLGSSVSLSNDGSKLAVGAIKAKNNNVQTGAVYLFTISGQGSLWGVVGTAKKMKKITHGTPSGLNLSELDYFGAGVSLSADGSKLAVGAFGDDTGKGDGDSFGNKGAVYLFTISGVSWDTVTLTKKIDDGHSSLTLGDGDSFGKSVSLSDNGTRLAVGAQSDGDGGGDRGAVYVFTISGVANNWGKANDAVTKILKLSDKADDDGQVNISLTNKANFGGSVSLSGDGTKLAVGAHDDDNPNTSGSDGTGSVRLINLPDNILKASAIEASLTIASFKIVASNDIVISDEINTLTGGGGKLTLIAGRSIKIDANVQIDKGLEIIANTDGNKSDGDNGDKQLLVTHRDAGQAKITVATGKTISGGKEDLLIKMLTGGTSNPANKKQTGAITVWKAEGQRVSIVHSGTTDANNDSEIVIRSGGYIESKKDLKTGDIGIELVADKITNNVGADALKLDTTNNSDGNGRYLIWTTSVANNNIGGITPGFTQTKAYNFEGVDFQSNTDESSGDRKEKSGFIYKPVSSSDSGGGGGSGGGAAIVLIGAGVAVVAIGGIGGGAAAAGAGAAGAGAGGASGGLATPVGSIDTLFNTSIYAYLNGIDMQVIYQPPTQPSVFNTPYKVTYKAKYHRTYDMALLAHNIKAQKAVPLYELDENLYETIKEIFVQQSAPTDKTARTDTQRA